MYKKIITSLFIIFFLQISILGEEVVNLNSIDIQAVETTQESKYPDYAKMYIGEDKHEKFNRKMFNLNTKLNKFIAKPVHILWASVMPKFGMDRIRDAYNNIEYPKRLASCILQRDGKALKDETVRFITNTTIGLGGLFDPADKIFKVKPTNENMEQALCKCKMGSGSYLVMPCLHSCTPRSLCGRALEAALDPSVYLASPITSIVKFGLMVNRTSYLQQLAKMIETNYADPYDIHKKLFGLENYIRNSNYDRKELNIEEALETKTNKNESFSELFNNSKNAITDLNPDEDINSENITNINNLINPDILLEGYKVQTPVIDAMKTAFFENKDVNKSIWSELSIWNRSFAKRIKTGSVNVSDGKTPYKFRYILQKDKSSPLVFLYPSIGESAENHHSIVFAKMFYDEGYSVVMQGSHFHWEFAKSMPEGYAPGIPQNDAKYVREISLNIIDYLKNKHDKEFEDKIIFGTSFGGVAALFVADLESRENLLGIKKIIAVSPPIELKYALEQVDKNSEEFDKNSPEVKDKTAITASKILQILDKKNTNEYDKEFLPFSDEEGKMISTFIMRQKLSDLIFTLENPEKNKEKELYKMINNMSYRDYAEKYLLGDKDENEVFSKATLYSLENYLANNDNYIIYESFDDYFINKEQISKLKNITGEKLICLNCGSHLGFLYRKEFLESLKKDIEYKHLISESYFEQEVTK